MPISSQPAFSHGNPVKLFELRDIFGYPTRTWDVAPDGQRFVAIKADTSTLPPSSSDDDRPSFVFIVNWVEELRRTLSR